MLHCHGERPKGAWPSHLSTLSSPCSLDSLDLLGYLNSPDSLDHLGYLDLPDQPGSSDWL